ncbi:MAG TPA: phage tail protein [Polyangia bacterium]|jgi:phage tail-like protein|nr:phage tail protein [Polyangia bacterium]
MTQRMKPYTGGSFALELDQKNSAVGWLTSIDGGHFKTTSVDSQVGRDGYVTRYAGKPSYDDVTIGCGAAMSGAFWQWVQASLNRKPERRNGALVAYDFNQRERSRRTFKRALISEIGFPALDAASKSAAALSIKFSPEQITYEEGSGDAMLSQANNDEMRKSKHWLACNFNFALEKFKGDVALRNCKVEAFTIKQNIIVNNVGAELEPRKEPGRLELPQVVVTFPESMAKDWFAWFDKANRLGNRSDQYTTGQIQYLAPDNRSELMRVELDGVSLISIEVDKLEAQREGIANVKCTLNVETMTLVRGPGLV